MVEPDPASWSFHQVSLAIGQGSGSLTVVETMTRYLSLQYASFTLEAKGENMAERLVEEQMPVDPRDWVELLA